MSEHNPIVVKAHTRNNGNTTIKSLKRKRKEYLEGMERIQYQPNVKKAKFIIKDKNKLVKLREDFPLALKCEFSGKNNSASVDVEIDFKQINKFIPTFRNGLKEAVEEKDLSRFQVEITRRNKNKYKKNNKLKNKNTSIQGMTQSLATSDSVLNVRDAMSTGEMCRVTKLDDQTQSITGLAGMDSFAVSNNTQLYSNNGLPDHHQQSQQHLLQFNQQNQYYLPQNQQCLHLYQQHSPLNQFHSCLYQQYSFLNQRHLSISKIPYMSSSVVHVTESKNNELQHHQQQIQWPDYYESFPYPEHQYQSLNQYHILQDPRPSFQTQHIQQKANQPIQL